MIRIYNHKYDVWLQDIGLLETWLIARTSTHYLKALDYHKWGDKRT